MTTREKKPYISLIINTLTKTGTFNKCRKAFLCEVFVLFLSIKGRINFLQLARYGTHGEQRYRQQFEKPFPFMDFNKELILSHGGGRYAIAFDPSYLNKSGKKTPGVGWYWSGCAGKAKWGLEIGGIAVLDVDNHTAFHLEAVQTLPDKENDQENLCSWYARILKERKETLLQISTLLVCDAWFSKKPFVDAVLEMDMHLVSRLRDDADLRYLYHGPSEAKRGRPRKYAGKIDISNIDENYFELQKDDQEALIHSAIVYAKALKRNIRLVRVHYKTGKERQTVKLYFSTDLQINPTDLVRFYRSRFQMEFLYRDAKQHTGLCQTQARSESKLDFHFNMALTALNLAKVEDWICIPKKEREAFSMNDIKTVNHNRLLINRFIDVFGINPNKMKNQQLFKELLYYGTRAA